MDRRWKDDRPKIFKLQGSWVLSLLQEFQTVMTRFCPPEEHLSHNVVSMLQFNDANKSMSRLTQSKLLLTWTKHCQQLLGRWKVKNQSWRSHAQFVWNYCLLSKARGKRKPRFDRNSCLQPSSGNGCVRSIEKKKKQAISHHTKIWNFLMFKS